MARGASESEIEALYREQFDFVCNCLLAITHDRDRAVDGTQEAFALALRHRRTFRREGTLLAWIWRIATREALSRTTGSNATVDLDEIFADAVAPAADRDAELAEALRRLPRRRKTVVFLRYFADLSYADIASVCGISEGTVAATLSQAHQELFTALETEGAWSR
jgi:RNA polymerase sigma-70 factor (ECF subfamily)